MRTAIFRENRGAFNLDCLVLVIVIERKQIEREQEHEHDYERSVIQLYPRRRLMVGTPRCGVRMRRD
jgi:hypothetical protein